jgi:hypothetical protein
MSCKKPIVSLTAVFKVGKQANEHKGTVPVCDFFQHHQLYRLPKKIAAKKKRREEVGAASRFAP